MSSLDELVSKSMVRSYSASSKRGQSSAGEAFCPTAPTQPLPVYRMDVMSVTPIVSIAACRAAIGSWAAAGPAASITAATNETIRFSMVPSALPDDLRRTNRGGRNPFGLQMRKA